MDDLAPRPDRVTADRDRHDTTVTGSWEPAAQTEPDTGDLVGYRDLVIALARRNQSLVQRQLQLLKRPEHGAEDAQDALPLLGILATRIRHNNENLMVLSGTEPGRSVQPVTISDLLREAVSTCEQQERIDVGTPPSARIVGQAAGDLVRLLAELLDNAASFSAPETPVTVGTRVFDGGGLVIDIADRGLGMGEAEIAAANARLTGAGPAGSPTPHQVGLRVTRALAGRHAIAVALHAEGDATGVRASVTVPPDLVTDLAETVPIRPIPVPNPGPGAPDRPPAEDPGLPTEPTEPAAYLGFTDQTAGSEPARSWPSPALPELGLDQIGTPAARPESRWRLPESEAEVGALPETSESGAVAEWWTAEATPGAPAAPETTPIFDEMVSAWFRDEPEEPAVADQPEAAPAPTAGWAFEADAGWRTVQEVTRSEPTSYTEVGLPRRRRGEQLMPGGIAAGAGGLTPPAESGARRSARDADGVRGRLSNFQRGVRRARDISREPPAPAIADPQPRLGSWPAAESVPREPAWSFTAGETGQAIEEIAHPEPDPAPRTRVRRGRHRLVDEGDPDAESGA